MTVEQLMDSLKKMPKDAKVTILDYNSLWQTGRIDVENVEKENRNGEITVLIY
jgi:hypothetical protein